MGTSIYIFQKEVELNESKGNTYEVTFKSDEEDSELQMCPMARLYKKSPNTQNITVSEGDVSK